MWGGGGGGGAVGVWGWGGWGGGGGGEGGCCLDWIGVCGWRFGGWEGEGKDMDLEVWGKGVVGEGVCGKEAERAKMVREEGEGVGLEGEGFDDGCGSVKDVREMV